MKIIYLSNGGFAKVDDADYDFVNERNWFGLMKHKSVDGHENWYAFTTRGRCRIPMHRFILGCEAGNGLTIDHINGDGLDNRRCNLRICTQQQNCCNKRNSWSSTGYRGVFRERIRSGGFKYRAQIGYGMEKITIGFYLTPEDAALAYNQKALELNGDFASLNTIRSEDEQIGNNKTGPDQLALPCF